MQDVTSDEEGEDPVPPKVGAPMYSLNWLLIVKQNKKKTSKSAEVEEDEDDEDDDAPKKVRIPKLFSMLFVYRLQRRKRTDTADEDMLDDLNAEEKKHDIRTQLRLQPGGVIANMSGMHPMLKTAPKDAMNKCFPVHLYNTDVYPKTPEEQHEIAAKAFREAIEPNVFKPLRERWRVDKEWRTRLCVFVSTGAIASHRRILTMSGTIPDLE